MNIVEKLRSLVVEIRKAAAPPLAKGEWELAGRLLARMPVDQEQARQACGAWDVDALEALVLQLEGRASEQPAGASRRGAPETTQTVPQLEMDRALRAFRKRLKLQRLADESRLGGGRKTTSGRKSQIDAILPPHEFSAEVWESLARTGKLKNEGGGFYSLVE